MDQAKPIYNVLIVGSGQIGAFFDQPGSSDVLTHAHAFSRHPGFNLLGFIDNKPQQARRAAEIWGGQLFPSIEDAFKREQVDVVCLAVPDEYHYNYLAKLADCEIQLVFAEKPLTQTLSEAEDIKNLYSRSDVSVAINYSRRYVPEFKKLQQRIYNEDFGAYLTGSGYYGKGLQHNGSHMLNLLEYLLGEISGGKLTREETDFYREDSSVTVVLDVDKHGNFYMQNVDCRAYTLFEFDLLFTRKRIRILDSGFYIEEYDVIDNPIFAGYRSLGLTAEYKTSLGRAMEYAVQNLYDYLSEGLPLLCSLEEGYRVMKICADLRKGT